MKAGTSLLRVGDTKPLEGHGRRWGEHTKAEAPQGGMGGMKTQEGT